MAPVTNLQSPIELPVNRRIPHPHLAFPFVQSQTENEFVHYGSPYDQINRIFVGLNPSWNEIDAIEFHEGIPVGFVSQCKLEEKEIPVQRLRQSSHPSLLKIREVFFLKGSAYFIYDQWGLTLAEILHLSPVFRLSEVEVAVICKAVLLGLRYIHKELDIHYGGLSPSKILVTNMGEVKITGIGKRLFQKPSSLEKARDVQAVCRLARCLLDDEETTSVHGTIGLLAEDFAGAPATVTADELLQVSICSDNPVSFV
ncbi:hypothetical protein BO99DRAFT_452749 [Aspergillus violaceofuscus CBS 115571]|uniref:Protein kinase domain-containing protein n=1 Tax=Aspergillus violaceofuscus (strain CBS 115571) TaxID=1450538 RepID=A0A2V5GR42_ASPV1|nr:hypothetical protein BO99DRAFT_452749 [Aspergillus violaceofuscus CBS 115571]